jgi:hypothetical protein
MTPGLETPVAPKPELAPEFMFDEFGKPMKGEGT